MKRNVTMLAIPECRLDEANATYQLTEGNETVTNCNGLKMTASDGNMRMTDVGNIEWVNI